LIEVGTLELNRNPDNYFAEVEQSSFSPSAMVPGIAASPDKMLQARLMSYADAHRYRVGNNFQQLPINRPQCPIFNTERDGVMATAQDYESSANYWPSSRDGAPEPDPAYIDPAWDLGQTVVDRYDFTQPGNLYRLFDDDHRDRLTTRIAGVLGQARPEVQMRQLCHFFRADPDYGMRVANKLGIDVSQFMPTTAAAT
jgi:catalase